MPDDFANAATPLWHAQLPGRPLAGLTVLVVEDSRFASEAVRLLCLRSGARIRRAENLQSAHRHLRTYRPAVVIVDVGLPDGSGTTLIRAVADLRPSVPVILGMSGDDGNRDSAIAAGAHGFLAKPIESLAVFQQTILAALPPAARKKGLRLLPDDRIVPDDASLRDDLTLVAQTLAAADTAGGIDYIVNFLAGVARSSHDTPLADAADALARDHSEGRALAAGLARLSGMVQDRLGKVSAG
ncbi:MAG: response regulator [Paracoccus denitrificans]|nr:MAG: response regulator [Paracoccus denitrificans]PZO83449.1 MAG: response regulator [Paracoccus denitrificans]